MAKSNEWIASIENGIKYISNVCKNRGIKCYRLLNEKGVEIFLKNQCVKVISENNPANTYSIHSKDGIKERRTLAEVFQYLNAII